MTTKENGPSGCRQWVPLLRQRPQGQAVLPVAGRPRRASGLATGPDGKAARSRAIRVPEPLVDTPATRADLAAYYDEVQRLDRFVGKVVEELKAQEHPRRIPLVLFISDNGRPFPRAKRWITEEGSRTPWIMHWPGGIGERGQGLRATGQRDRHRPDLPGARRGGRPRAVQGRSLLPQIADPEAKICEYVFARAELAGRILPRTACCATAPGLLPERRARAGPLRLRQCDLQDTLRRLHGPLERVPLRRSR